MKHFLIIALYKPCFGELTEPLTEYFRK